MDRRSAMKKMGWGALTATSMMTILNAHAGTWDDMNQRNGFNSDRSYYEPASSPEDGGSSTFLILASSEPQGSSGKYRVNWEVSNIGDETAKGVDIQVQVDGIIRDTVTNQNIKPNKSEKGKINNLEQQPSSIMVVVYHDGKEYPQTF